MSNRKPLDVTAFYDEFRKRAGTYALSVDISNFAAVNENYGMPVGDIVIAEASARLASEIAVEMPLFRIGGDEFAVLTGYKTAAEAEALARKITARNGDTVKANEHQIPLTLKIGVSFIPERALSYDDALNILAEIIEQARMTPDGIAVCAV